MTGSSPTSCAILVLSIPTLSYMQLLPGGFPSSISPPTLEPARLNGKFYLSPAKRG